MLPLPVSEGLGGNLGYGVPSDQHPDINWTDGVPVSARFNDPYFSLNGGLAESRHVFLTGNELPARFAPGFRIAELGFGTGLNCLAAWNSWRKSGTSGDLQYVAFERFPMAAGDMAKALSPFPEIADMAAELIGALANGATKAELPRLDLELIVGDARETLPEWQGLANAWFLDGFAPVKNPELWEPELLSILAQRLAPGGSLATYTAAGDVRRSLAAAGLRVARRPGYGRKRHMTVAWKLR